MSIFSNAITRRASLLLAALLVAGCAGVQRGAEINVMTSGGFAAAYDELRPAYERLSGDTVKTAYGSSMGGATDSIPSRMARGEPVDVVILARPALDALVAQGKVVPGSQVDLVNSLIGFSVKTGTPKPDVVATKIAAIAAHDRARRSPSATRVQHSNLRVSRRASRKRPHLRDHRTLTPV